MKYKVGDKVRVKSLEWYNANKDEDGDIPLIQMCGSKYNFIDDMSCFCGKIVTINNVCHRGYYDIKEDNCCWYWTDEMFEGLVEHDDVVKSKMVSLDKVKEWLNKNLTTEYLYAHENDYPISYVRVMGKNQTVYDVVEQFCKAMEG